MTRRPMLAFLACMFLWTLSGPTPATAGDLLARILGRGPSPPPAYLGNPKQIVPSQPAPHPYYPEHNVAGPWYGYGFGVPAYPWGYFGARYRPAVVSHHGYYGDFTQWGYRYGF